MLFIVHITIHALSQLNFCHLHRTEKCDFSYCIEMLNIRGKNLYPLLRINTVSM
jgi:hypothetical protein